MVSHHSGVLGSNRESEESESSWKPSLSSISFRLRSGWIQLPTLRSSWSRETPTVLQCSRVLSLLLARAAINSEPSKHLVWPVPKDHRLTMLIAGG